MESKCKYIIFFFQYEYTVSLPHLNASPGREEAMGAAAPACSQRSHPFQAKNSRIVIDFSLSFVYDKIVKNGILGRKRQNPSLSAVYPIN